MTEHQVVFTTLDKQQPWTLENYLAVDGYKAWRKILEGKTPPGEIIDQVKASALSRVVGHHARFGTGNDLLLPLVVDHHRRGPRIGDLFSWGRPNRLTGSRV